MACGLKETNGNNNVDWPDLKARVVQGLKCCGSSYDVGDCRDCPYDNNCAVGVGDKIYWDALKLIEEYDRVLKTMVYVNCTECVNYKDFFIYGHMHFAESAFELLGIKHGQEVPENWI